MKKNKFELMHDKFLAEVAKGKRQSPLRAIRMHCLNCVCWVHSEVNKCLSVECPLYKFRFGKNESGKRGTGRIRKYSKI